MKMTEQQDIEQLYYTWSRSGIDSVVTGSRIRAASEGLSKPSTERVQKLVPYESYKLPSEADPFTMPITSAPVCLSLLFVGSERVLVQKVYRGKDDLGRHGAFFAHFFVGLPPPEVFSPLDAIKLWKSPLFKRSEDGLDPDKTDLQRETIATLKAYGQDIQSVGATIERAQAYFPYIMEAYLTKRPITQRKSAELVPQPLYIAASDDDIAYFLFGLLHCLPPRLVQNITYSTYEHDAAKASVEIIGTCWMSGYDRDQQHTTALFPSLYYEKGQKLAINCYTGQSSSLLDNVLVKYHTDAANFAQDALAYLEHGSVPDFDFERLLKDANSDEKLNAVTFLNLYHKYKYTPPSPIPPISPQPSMTWELKDIALIESFIKTPVLLQDNHIQIAESISRLRVNQNVPWERILSLKGLVGAFATSIENGAQAAIVFSAMKVAFAPFELIEFLCEVAASVQEGVQQGQYPLSRILAYLELSFSFKTIFYAPVLNAKQVQDGVQRLLKILLADMDKETFRWFTAEAKNWNEIVVRWRRYEEYLNPSTPVGLPELSSKVRKRIEKALNTGKIKHIVEVATVYYLATDPIAPLKDHIQKMPSEWREPLTAAFAFFFAYEDINDKSINKESRAVALIEAYKKICDIPIVGCPQLKLTKDEKQWYEIAKDYLADIELHKKAEGQQHQIEITNVQMSQLGGASPSTGKVETDFLGWLAHQLGLPYKKD